VKTVIKMRTLKNYNLEGNYFIVMIIMAIVLTSYTMVINWGNIPDKIGRIEIGNYNTAEHSIDEAKAKDEICVLKFVTNSRLVEKCVNREGKCRWYAYNTENNKLNIGNDIDIENNKKLKTCRGIRARDIRADRL